MLTRVFRLTDRSGRLLVKATDQAGAKLSHAMETPREWLTSRVGKSSFNTDSARVEGQVRSLSGLVVVLLVGVGTLLLWATSSQAQNNPVTTILGIGATAAPAVSAPQPVPPADDKSFRGSAGTLIFSMPAGAYQNLFALSSGQAAPTRLTSGEADDIDPAWSPDGQQIAFASHRDGNWDLYLLSLASGEVKRLTKDLVYESKPSWSPDSKWIAYEGYASGNLDVFIVRADGSEGPYPVTRNAAADFDPAWGPNGRTIAYVSNRDGNQDIYLISLDEPNEDKAINLTHTPDIDESDPVWSPDGTAIAYEGVTDGIPLIYVQSVEQPNPGPIVIGQGTSPAWSPDGGELAFVATRAQGSLLLTGQYGAWNSSVQAFVLPGPAASLSWTSAGLPNPPQGSLAFAASAPIAPAYTEAIAAPQGQNDAPYRLINLAGVSASSQPYLSDQVDGSFSALRDAINRRAGWDFLARLDQVWWPLDHLAEPGQPFQNWHKTGRAFDVVQSYNEGNPAQVEVVREQSGPDVVWRLYVRSAAQDGTLGEPLHQLPWDFAARTSGDTVAYEQGGRLKSAIPSGYYVDFTALAELYGWERTASDQSWRQNWPGVLYWQYEKPDGLDWWNAMLQLYPESTLRQAFSTPTPGAPPPTEAIPVSPTPTAANGSPTAKPTAGPRPTATHAPTPTPPEPGGFEP